MHFPYQILFDQKTIIRNLLKLPKDNKYRILLSKIIIKPKSEIWKILVDSFFMKEFNRTFYKSCLIIPPPLLEISGDFTTYLSNIIKKMVSNNMNNYHGDLNLTTAKQGQGLFSDEIKKRFGTIFTPDFVVDKCIDLVWKYSKKDRLQSTYCDPACGDGNFLVALYLRLMKEPSVMSDPEKSRHIIENLLYGYDIIDGMVEGAKIALYLQHCKTCGPNFIDIDKFNIYHGNTICLPEDTKQDWYMERDNYEGGLLVEELRSLKYDVVLGNPPYTHLRNLNNRRYHAYPKQRDLAQVFVRWALDHLNEDGMISYNIVDTWLNVKTSDGARETRSLINGKIREILQDEEITRYSEHDGGNIGTMVFVIGNEDSKIVVNNVKYQDSNIFATRFIEQFKEVNLPYKYTNITDYTVKMCGVRSASQEHNKFLVKIDNGDKWYVLSKCIVGQQSARNWMLVNIDDIKNLINDNINSEVKYFEMSKGHAIWMFGFLNSEYGVQMVKSTFRDGGKSSTWVVVLSNNMFQTMKVPDFDYYKTNKPQQFQSYMSWIELNMHDKDKFLAGIDEQFEMLIAE